MEIGVLTGVFFMFTVSAVVIMFIGYTLGRW